MAPPPVEAPASAPAPVARDVAIEPPIEPAIEKPTAPPRREPPPPVRPRQAFSPGPPPLRRTPVDPAPTVPEPKPEPKEVDRYTTAGATYVMMSDGSVEMRGPEGVRRYASLAELKAQTAPPSR